MKKTIIKFIATPAACALLLIGLLVISAEPCEDVAFSDIFTAQLIGWLLIIIGGIACKWVYDHGGMDSDQEYEDTEI